MFRGIWRKVYTLCTTQGVACSRHVPLPWLLSILHTTARSGFLLMSPLFLQFSFLFALARESRKAKILWWTAWEGNKFDNFYTDCLLTFFNSSRFFLTYFAKKSYSSKWIHRQFSNVWVCVSSKICGKKSVSHSFPIHLCSFHTFW